MDSSATYWCHQCRKQITPRINNNGEELLCPTCNGDFIELVEEDSQTNSGGDHPSHFVMASTASNNNVPQPTFNFGTPQTSSSSSSTSNPQTQPSSQPSQQPQPQPQPFPNIFTFPFGNFPPSNNNPNVNMNNNNPFAQLFTMLSQGNNNFNNTTNVPPNNTTTNNGNPTGNFQSQQTFQHGPFVFSTTIEGGNMGDIATMMNQLFGGLATANGGGGGGAQPINFNNLFGPALGMYGNPGDYAWGPQFENLMNQFFNQANRRGNPPAAENAMNSLPTVEITEEQVSGGLDCAICKDEFELNQSVVKMPCNHVFHRECLFTWLKMHNQCPICRHELPTDDQDYEERKKRTRTT